MKASNEEVLIKDLDLNASQKVQLQHVTTLALDHVIPKVIGSSLQQPLPQPITIYHTSLTRDKLSVFPVLEPLNTGLETTVSSSTAAQNNVALMPKFWGDLVDAKGSHSPTSEKYNTKRHQHCSYT